MGAGNPVIAHDNPYNRWVAGDAARYFTTETDVDQAISDLTTDPGLVARLSAAARTRHAVEFTWEHVAGQYEKLLLKALDKYRMQPGRSGRSIRTEAT
jgi:glycosyltransferase involved in cell wall biosynthesis